MAYKADPNTIREFPVHGVTALQACARNGSTGSAKLLIAATANVNPEPDAHGDTPLKVAQRFKHNGVAMALVEAGAIIPIGSK